MLPESLGKVITNQTPNVGQMQLPAKRAAHLLLSIFWVQGGTQIFLMRRQKKGQEESFDAYFDTIYTPEACELLLFPFSTRWSLGVEDHPSVTRSLENDVTGDLDSIMRRRLACLYLGYIIWVCLELEL